MSNAPINWPENGLIPVVIQSDDSDLVLMTGFMNADALEATRATGEVHFWSRSRHELWHKGATSGHVQKVRSIAINCNRDSLLIRVEQIGATCHDGYDTCYYRDLLADGTLSMNRNRLFDPRDVYGDGYGLKGATRLWWHAYEWLGNQPIIEESNTSVLLHGETEVTLPRVRDELIELAGVLDGTHTHTDPASDVMLEASQCCYWIVLTGINAGFGWGDIRPDRAMDVTGTAGRPETVARLLHQFARDLPAAPDAANLSYAFHMVATAARVAGVDPLAVIHRDLDELKSKAYLNPYFTR